MFMNESKILAEKLKTKTFFMLTGFLRDDKIQQHDV